MPLFFSRLFIFCLSQSVHIIPREPANHFHHKKQQQQLMLSAAAVYAQTAGPKL
jgi:hypothetical protein